MVPPWAIISPKRRLREWGDVHVAIKSPTPANPLEVGEALVGRPLKAEFYGLETYEEKALG